MRMKFKSYTADETNRITRMENCLTMMPQEGVAVQNIRTMKDILDFLKRIMLI
jgi:hypothetical protein